MVIIHIACIKDLVSSGVGVVVPQHVSNQQKIEEVGFINISNIHIGIENQFEYKSNLKISSLPHPFSKPDLVVFHEIYYLEYIRLYMHLNNMKIPYIVIPHGGLTLKAQAMKKLKKSIANILLFNRYIDSAKSIHYLSKEEKEDSMISRECFVAPNGIRINERNTVNFKGNTIVFTYIGRISTYIKGLDLLIEAFRLVKSSGKKIELNIYGPECQDSDNLRKLIIEYNLQSLISINGRVSGNEKLNILRNTSFFIQTSRFEGMPMGVLEALSYGIPCCVTKGTNLCDYISNYNAGWCCDSSIVEISDMINSVIFESFDYKSMSENAIRLIKENFEWSLVANKTIEQYKKYL